MMRQNKKKCGAKERLPGVLCVILSCVMLCGMVSAVEAADTMELTETTDASMETEATAEEAVMKSMVEIPVEQTLSTNSTQPDQMKQTYTYILKAKEGTPMPEGSENGEYTFSITGSSTAAVGPIVYQEVGGYQYELRQIIGENTSFYTYDDTVYTVNVYVKNGVDKTLVSQMVIKDETGAKMEAAEFENVYIVEQTSITKIEPPTKATIVKKSVQVKTGDELSGKMILGTLLVLLISVETIRRNLRRKNEMKTE